MAHLPPAGRGHLEGTHVRLLLGILTPHLAHTALQIFVELMSDISNSSSFEFRLLIRIFKHFMPGSF